MKSEKEIRDEIQACQNNNQMYRDMYKYNDISKRTLKSKLLQNDAMIAALWWVLGKNDRFD